MLLTLSRRDAQGHPTEFQSQIITGRKKHTIRKGFRWKPGNKIHFWMESPRNVTKDPVAFKIPRDAADFWNEEGDPLCAATEKIEFIFPDTGHVLCRIGNLNVTKDILEVLAMADGFESIEAFVDWFRRQADADKEKSGNPISSWSGQIVHWTDNVYDYDSAQIFAV